MTEIISSRQNPRVVRLVGLSDRKKRDAEGVFRFDGIKLFCEARRKGVTMDTVFLRASSAARLEERAHELYGMENAFANLPVCHLEDGLFDRISEEKSPEGVICVAKYIDKIRKIITIDNMTVSAEDRILLLECMQDPSNLGAVIRSAAALGIDRIICSLDSADPYHAKTLRASMGTLFDVAIDQTADLPGVIRTLRTAGRRVFAAALDDRAQKLGSFSSVKGDCAVIGNEGHGLRSETLDACTGTVYIPMKSGVESLNAAVAAALFLWELNR